MIDFTAIFVYLGEQPLIWLTLTLGAWVCANKLFHLSGRLALANPVLISALLICAVLKLSATPYDAYFEGAQFIHFLLGPAIIVLAVPIYQQRQSIWRARYAVLASLIAGAFCTGISAIGLSLLFDFDVQLIAAMTPKSVTAPVAMGIAEKLGGAVSLAAMLAVVTGISGAVMVTPLFNVLGFSDWRARGFALGITSHGIGTAHAFQVHQVAGSFATMGMAMNGLFSALILPALFHLLV